MRHERRDGQQPNKWMWSLGKTTPLLFRLPSVLAAVRRGETVFVAEGEKDVLALERAGATATTNHGGAGQWRLAHTEGLKGAAEVVVIADKDEPGLRHARHVATALTPVVGSVRIVEAATGKDAADHLGAGRGLDEFVELEEEQAEPAPESPAKPEIAVVPMVRLVVDAAELALLNNQRVELYQRSREIVRVVRTAGKKPKLLRRPPSAPLIAPVCDAHLGEQLSRSATWIQELKSGDIKEVRPPTWVVKTLAARRGWDLPVLVAVVESPAFRFDGTILDQPGYDETTGLLYEPNANFPPVPVSPTQQDADAALKLLLEPFEEFPFQAASDRAAVLAGILTIVGRHAIDGPTPMFAALAPAPGTGKGLLVLCMVLIATGRQPALMAAVHDAEELRKVITTIAAEGHAAVLFDNAEGRFGSPVLAAALTASEWSGRILGVSRTITAPLLNAWFVTGNNLSFVGDTGRRIVPIHLDACVETPEDRKFQRPDLVSFVTQNRPQLYSAALTVLRDYYLAGCPRHGKSRLGSFESWDDVVRGATIWALGADPLAGRARMKEAADGDREEMRVFFRSWFESFKSKPRTVREAIQLANENPGGLLHTALAAACPKGNPNTTEIGYRLRKWRDRIVDGLRLEKADDSRHGALWRTRQIAPDPLERDDGDDRDDGFGHENSKTQAEETERPRHDQVFDSQRPDQSSPSSHRHASDGFREIL